MNRKMIAWIMVSALAVSMLTSCSAGMEGTSAGGGKAEKSAKVELALKERTYDVAVDENENIYTADEDGIHIFDRAGAKVKDLAPDGVKPGALCVEGKSIYVYNLDKREIVTLDMEGIVTATQPVDGKMNAVYKMRKQGDAIYLLADSGMNERQLLKLDGASGRTEKLGIEGILTFSGYKGDGLLVAVRADSADSLRVYDLKSGELKQLGEFDTRVEGMEYDPGANQLFYTDSDNLFRLDTGKWKSLFAGTLSDDELGEGFASMVDAAGGENLFYYMMKGHGVMLAGDHAYTFNQASGPLVRFSKAVNPEQKVLRLLKNAGVPFMDRQVTLAFKEKHGDVPVVVSSLNAENYYEKLSVLLLSGDNSMDLFTLGADKAGEFFEKGIFSDLSAYPALKEKYGRMLPAIAEGCTRDGKIIGAPAWMSIPVLNYEKDLASAMKVDIKEESNWKELLETFRRVHETAGKGQKEEKDGKNGEEGVRALAASWEDLQEWMFGQYCVNNLSGTGKGSYDTPQFREVLEMLKELKNGKLFKETEQFSLSGNGTAGIGFTAAAATIGGEGKDPGNLFRLSELQSVMLNQQDSPLGGAVTIMGGVGKDFIPLPLLDSGNGSRPYRMELLVVNPRSGNKELAAEYADIMLTPATFLPKENKNKKVEQEAKDGNSVVAISISMLDVSRILYNDFSLYKGLDREWFDRFIRLMERSKVSTAEQVFKASEEILKQFYNGSIDAAGAASMIESKAKKINE